MSLKQVKEFYQRLVSDEVFRSQIQAVKSKEECSQIVKTAGFNFTQQDFEDYTSQLLLIYSNPKCKKIGFTNALLKLNTNTIRSQL